nr:FKBP-type peptidyl-prolyl cis-trans isomerase [Nanchangia anserum]
MTGCSNSDEGAEKTAQFPAVTGEREHPTIEKGAGTPSTTTISRVLTKGTGAEVKKSDTVCVDYIGQTWQGTVFDQSYNATEGPRVFSLNQVVPGWQKGLAGKHVGDRVQIVIPPEDGYGEQGQGDLIPANATLVFVVDIIGAIDVTDTSALTKAKPNDKADIPAWLKVGGKLGQKPTITVGDNPEIPTEQKVIILAEGTGETIEADDYVAAHMSVVPLGDGEGQAAQSTWDMKSMQVTNGPVGQSPVYTGMKIGTRAIILTPGGQSSDGQKVPAAVYVIDYGAKMTATRGGSK